MPTFNLDERLCIITDPEAYEFFRFRSGGHVLDSSPDMQLEEGQRKVAKKEHDEIMLANFKTLRGPDMEHARRPVDYFIDEVHEIFPSREWDKGGRGILFYASKHRHLHDEIFLITQQIDQVEKQLRNLTSETVVVRNHLRRNVGLWKAKPVFKLKLFYGLPSPTAKPFMEPEMRLDLQGAAACYKTTGALGVHDAPEKVHNKGVLPYWTMWAAGGVFVLGIVGAFTLLPYAGAWISGRIVGGASSEIQRMTKGVPAQTSVPAGATAVERAAADVPVPAARPASRAKPAVDASREIEIRRTSGESASQDVFPTGVSRAGARIVVSMSDGTTLENVPFRAPGMVLVDGRWMRIRANPHAKSAPVSVAPKVEPEKPALTSPPMVIEPERVGDFETGSDGVRRIRVGAAVSSFGATR